MPNLGAFKHGVSWEDVPTSVISPVAAYPGMNVVIGSAPIWQCTDPVLGPKLVNTPRIYNSYEEAVAEMGYSNDWKTYDICEHMDALFVEFGMYPVTYINVLDPTKAAVVVPPTNYDLVNGQIDTGKSFIGWTITVAAGTTKGADKTTPPGANSGASTPPGSTPPPAPPGSTPPPAPKAGNYVLGVDYLLSLSANNTWIVTRIEGGAIPTDTSGVMVGGKTPGTTPVGATDIIGGVDQTTGKRTGIEAVEDVFQLTGYVPGILIAPLWSHNALVASALEAKCENINGCFAATCLIDVDTSATATPPVKTAQDVIGTAGWKNVNNIVSPRQQCLFGNPALVGVTSGQPGSAVTVTKKFHFASQQGPLMQWTDTYKGGGLPYCSPSNKNLRMNSLQMDDNSEVPMHLLDANMLNGQGVVTALNWIGGWRSWGNRTAAYPANSDVKDMFIPVRRMFDYIGNTLILTVWQKVDEPGNRRLIDAIVNSLQLWLDGLTATEALLGARIEFNQSENPTTELLNGHYTFHIFIAVPTPAEWLDFKIEYWVPYIADLWPTTQNAVAA